MPKHSIIKVLLPVITLGICPLVARAATPVASVASKTAPDSVINSGQTPRAVTQDKSTGEPLITALPAVAAMAAPVAAPSNELAELDAKLASAQDKLADARQQLSEGQKQLQVLNGAMRLAMRDAGPDAAGLHPFVRVASRYAGTPYVWGGESRYGFDCSGFIIRVMRDLGYKALPHSAAEQFTYGSPVAKSLLKPGDLVFFANTYKPGISHVGIYIGRHQFIHAASTTKGTIVSDLRDAFYTQHYAGARRLAPVK